MQKIKAKGVEIIGNAKDKASVLSFIMKNVHPHDIGTIMDSHGVAIRAGNHCTQPVMDFYSIPATARASFAIYNDKKGIHLCKTCDNRTDFAQVNIPYACKLLFHELITMNIAPRIITE